MVVDGQNIIKSVRVPLDLAERVEKVAEREGRDFSYVTREALEAYVRRRAR